MNMKERNNTLYKLQVSVNVFLWIFFIGVFCVVVGLIFSQKHTEVTEVEVPQREVYSYQSLKYDSEAEDYILGTMTSYKELKNDEFVSYEDDFGKRVLISHYGMDEFKCTGYCYCTEGVDEGERRVSTTLLKKPFFYLVAAVSSFVAYEIAQTKFQEECVKEMENTCHLSSIESEVDDCSDVTVKSKLKEKERGRDGGDEEEGVLKYVCIGHCAITQKFDAPLVEIMERTKDQYMYLYLKDLRAGCEKMKKKDTITISPGIKERTSLEYNRLAVEFFERKVLKKYCIERSIIATNVILDMLFQTNVGHFCSSTNDVKFPKMKNIECRKWEVVQKMKEDERIRKEMEAKKKQEEKEK